MNLLTNHYVNHKIILKYLCFCSYVGIKYHGFQYQNLIDKPENQRTIQESIENAIKNVFKEDIRIRPSSRTDAQVSARRLAIQFVVGRESNKRLFDDKIMRTALNFQLMKNSEDISINQVCLVPFQFNVKKNCLYKIYEYNIEANLNEFQFNDAIQQYKSVWNIPQMLDIDLLMQALNHFKGKQDFYNFSVNKNKKQQPDEEIDTIRTIDEIIYIPYENDYSDNKLQSFRIRFIGKSFLTYQVIYYQNIWLMIGFAVEVALGKQSIQKLLQLLDVNEAQKQNQVKWYQNQRPIAPGKGLVLIDVIYPEETQVLSELYCQEIERHNQKLKSNIL